MAVPCNANNRIENVQKNDKFFSKCWNCFYYTLILRRVYVPFSNEFIIQRCTQLSYAVSSISGRALRCNEKHNAV